MNREEFADYAAMALEDAVQFAEEKAGQKLPRRLSLQWRGQTERLTENIVKHLVDRTGLRLLRVRPPLVLPPEKPLHRLRVEVPALQLRIRKNSPAQRNLLWISRPR